MTAARGRIDRRRAGPLARVVSATGTLRWWVLAAALLSGLTLIAGIGLISLAGNLISRSALVDTTATLTLATVGVRFFAVTRAVGRYLERYVGHLGTFRILTRIRVWFFRGVEPTAPASLVDRRSGDVLTRIVDDVDTLQDLALRVIAPPIAAVMACGVGAVALGVLDPSLGVALLVFLLLGGVAVPLATRRLSRAASGVLVAEQAELGAVSVESISALADLVAYGREDLFARRLQELTDRRRAAERRLASARGLNLALVGLLGGLVAVTTLAVAVPLVTEGRLEGEWLAMVPLASIATFEAVAPLALAVEHLDRARRAAARLTDLVDSPATITEPTPSEPVPPYPGDGSITFDRVRFRYTADGPDVLDDASFSVPAGAQVVVVGPSGSGKSTIAALLLRFWEQQSGSVSIDGVDIRMQPSDRTRAAVAVVAQHDHLFDTTVRDNLRLGDADADDDRLVAACVAAGLGGWLDRQPEGLDARTGEDGSRLSGGERQRLMIARALLAESSILILDEATAHLDEDTARGVLDGVAAWRAGRTTIHIAHVGAPSGSPDLVLHVEAGRVRTTRPPGLL